MDFVNRLVQALLVTHPPHSMTVHFPIGLTGAAALFVALAPWRRSQALERAAFYNLALAALGALGAGLAGGARDNMIRYDGAAPQASLKMLFASTLVVLAVATASVRWKNPDLLWKPSTRVFYVAAVVTCFAPSAVLGFLGSPSPTGLTPAQKMTEQLRKSCKAERLGVVG